LDKNVGALDRTGRLIVGGIVILAALASFAGFYELGLGIGLAAILVGAILLVTGTTRKCSLNQAAGINT
jgi:membrane protein implicated in regulation of membrane protease activity